MSNSKENRIDPTNPNDAFVVCATCEQNVPAYDARECSRARCFDFVCDRCRTELQDELVVCSDGCAAEAVVALKEEIRAGREQRLAAARSAVDNVFATWAASAIPARKVA